MTDEAERLKNALGQNVPLGDGLGGEKSIVKAGYAGLQPGIEVVIIPDDKFFSVATQEERERAMTDLFSGLTDAIRKYGCKVDINNPRAIKVTKKLPPNVKLRGAPSTEGWRSH